MSSCVSLSNHPFSCGYLARLTLLSLCLLRVYSQHYDPNYQQVFYPAPPPYYYYYPQQPGPLLPPSVSEQFTAIAPPTRYQPPTYARVEPSPVVPRGLIDGGWKPVHPANNANEFNLPPPTAVALPLLAFPSTGFGSRSAFNYTHDNPPAPRRKVIYSAVPQERRNRIHPRKQRRLEQFEEYRSRHHSEISSPAPPEFATSSAAGRRLRIRTTTAPSVDLDDIDDTNDPNKVFFTCCKSKNVHKACESRCNFDTINKKTSYGLDLFSCAASHADHTACCRRKNVQRTKAGEKCLDFCNLSPDHTFQADGTHIPCWAVLNDVKSCFKEAIINHTV